MQKIILENAADTMLERYKNGDHLGVINRYAARNKVAREVIARFFADAGFETPIAPAQGEFDFQCKGSPKPQRNIKKKAPTAYSFAEEDMIVGMVAENAPYSQIADKLGRSPEAIVSKVCAMRKKGILPPAGPEWKKRKSPVLDPAAAPTSTTAPFDLQNRPNDMVIAAKLVQHIEDCGFSWQELTVERETSAITILFNAWGENFTFCLKSEGCPQTGLIIKEDVKC